MGSKRNTDRGDELNEQPACPISGVGTHYEGGFGGKVAEVIEEAAKAVLIEEKKTNE